MKLELAVVLQCDDTTCRLRLLERDVYLTASYSTAMLQYDIRAAPGQLVALDTAATPPQIVYHWAHICADQTPEGYTLTTDGQPIDPAQLRADEFPSIEATLESLDPKQLVRDGYDQIAERYLEWTHQDPNDKREKYVSLLLDELPAGAPVLELGCGAGVPATQMLAQRFQVTGVDISARQLELARRQVQAPRNVPQAHFIQADMAALDLPPESYAGVLSLFAIFHVPRDEQPQLLRNIAAWLRPGGQLIATMGTRSSPGGIEDDWLGAPMYWSTYDSATNVRIVQEAGLDMVSTEIETVEEFGETVSFLWIVARKPKDDA